MRQPDSPSSPERNQHSSSNGSHSGRRVEFHDDHGEPEDMTGLQTPTKSRAHDSESPGIKTVGTDDTTLTINHVNSTRKSRSLGGMSKPVMGLVGLLAFGSLGAGIWGFLTIPGLYEQIEELEFQVDRLTTQVDRLEGEVDRFSDLNDNLNATVIELQVINDELNQTATRLEISVENLEDLNDQLEAENNRYVELNNRLEAEVDQLEENVDDLEAANTELRGIVDDLQGETDRLGDTVDSLNTTAADLRLENNRLRDLNSNLETIVGFLDNTSGQISDTLENVTSYLAEQITGSRELLIENLEVSYTTKITNWDCNYRNSFRTEPFVINEDAVIGPADLPRVLAHVEDRVLAEFCVNREDFESYVDQRFGLASLSTNQLIQATNEYVGFVLSYYFPDPGQTGLTLADWAAADYACENVPEFVYTG